MALVTKQTTGEDTGATPDFTRSDARITELLNTMRDICALNDLGNLAGWDQNTQMPDGAGAVRGTQMAVLQGVLHDRWSSDALEKTACRARGSCSKRTFYRC